MQFLIEIASLCCLVLIGTALALWWSMRTHPAPAAPVEAPRPQLVVRRMPHPRLDLAAGMVSSDQFVRRRLVTRDVDAVMEAHVPKKGARSDRAYYNENFGDLTDPDLRKATAVAARRAV